MERIRLRLLAYLCLGTLLVSDPSAVRLLCEATEHVGSHGHCPCCPDDHEDPAGPKCPIPGGCALCNVAKTPCTTPPAPFHLLVACLGACDMEPISPYASTAGNRLIRPPRA